MTMRLAEREAAKKWLCRALTPFHVADPPVPPKALWPEIIRQADAWLVSSRLYLQVRSEGILPSEASDLLEAVTELTQARAQSMRADLCTIIKGLNKAGLEPVVIKGAEWLLGHYAPHAVRPIADLDIWFPTEAEQFAAIEVLRRQNYLPSTPLHTHDMATGHHFPPFHRDEDSARFELHHKLVRSTLVQALDVKRAVDRLRPERQAGLLYRRLDPMDGLTVAFLQSGRMATPAFETRRVTLSKWLDFMDRFHAIGMNEVSQPSDIGIIDGDDPMDRQLLTALAVVCGFPYSGPPDHTYLEDWGQKATIAGSLRSGFTWKKARSPTAWFNLIQHFPQRLKHIRFMNSL